jgi:di/tricarboxylate transporter
VAGIIYFLVLGRSVLPKRPKHEGEVSPQEELIQTWDLPRTIHQCVVPSDSSLIGKTREEALLCAEHGLHLLALSEHGDLVYAPWRFTRFAAGQELALLGDETAFHRFVEEYNVVVKERLNHFEDLQSEGEAGFAELIVPPRAPIAGKTIRQMAFRKSFGIEPIMLLGRGGGEAVGDLSDSTLSPGDALIVHGPWSSVKAAGDRKNFVLATQVPADKSEPSCPIRAMICFLGAIALAVSGAPLSVGLLTGAVAMVVFRVVPIDEAYRAVDWRTVFLLAGLIPLGIAMGNTGAAAYVANQMMHVLEGGHPLLVYAAFALLSTLFSLFMSNVAATVLLVPLVMLLAQGVGMDPRGIALLVAVCASNSFVLPTHQVNALLMSPGGYRNADYLRAGGIMTVVFIAIAVVMIYGIYG